MVELTGSVALISICIRVALLIIHFFIRGHLPLRTLNRFISLLRVNGDLLFVSHLVTVKVVKVLLQSILWLALMGILRVIRLLH